MAFQCHSLEAEGSLSSGTRPETQAKTFVIFPQTGLPVRGSYSFERGACSGRIIWRLSPGLMGSKLCFLNARKVKVKRKQSVQVPASFSFARKRLNWWLVRNGGCLE